MRNSIYSFFLLCALMLQCSNAALAKTASASSNEHKTKKSDHGAPHPAGIDMDVLEKTLKGDGLVGEIHAADATNRQFVFTFRDPKDFFNNVQIGMVSHDAQVISKLSNLHRHDRVRIKGALFHQGEVMPESPQPHIEVESLELVKAYESPVALPKTRFFKSAVLPDDLNGKSEADFLVHAVVRNGAALVLEYKDNFVFVTAPDTTVSSTLFRNDRIHMKFQKQNFPKKPVHLELAKGDPHEVIKVLDSIHLLHGKKYTQQGHLVRFPKSPQINRDIWAIEQASSDGNSRTFTLVNFTKKGEQERIDKKLKDIWDTQADTVVDGRNKLINEGVLIRASGVMNVVDPNQANAQMKLKAKDITVLSK